MFFPIRFRAPCLAAFLSLSSAGALAQTTYYVDVNGSSSGLGPGGASFTWSTSAANWNNSTFNTDAPVPWIDGNHANFTQHSLYIVTVSGTVEVANMSTSPTTTFTEGTINFGSGARQISNNVTGSDTFTINSAVTGTGSLTIEGSTISAVTFTGSASLDDGFNAIKGTTTFSGSGASLTTSGTGNINVGGGSESFTAKLNFTGGADLIDAFRVFVGTGSGTGTLTVSGIGSTLDVDQYIWIGNAGHSEGTMDITSGADVTTGTTVSVGDVTGSAGTLNVNGAGSTLSATGNIYVGYDSAGTALINAGAAVSTDAIFYVAANPTGDGDLTVDGTDTTLTIGTDLLIGTKHISGLTTSTSTSTVIVSNNATVTVGETVTIADLTGANDTVTLSSGGRLIVADQGGNNGIHAGSGTASFVLNGGELELNSTVGSSLTVDLNGSLTADSTFDAANGTLTYNGILSGTGGLMIASGGGGTVTLSAANLFSGDSTISNGTARVINTTGSAFGTGSVTLSSGTTLTGDGAFSGALHVGTGSTLAPGDSPGTLNAGNTTWAGGAAFEWEINNAAGIVSTNWDLLNITGGLTITATEANPFSINLVSLTTGNAAGDVINFDPNANAVYSIAATTTGISGFTSDAFTINSAGFSNSFDGLWSLAVDGNNLNLVYTSAVPEPTTASVLLGLLAWGFTATRRTRREVADTP